MHSVANPAIVKVAHGLSVFINWFNGMAALICGLWMMASALVDLPLSWNDWLPLSTYDAFPLHDVFFTSHFWPGLALALVNGAPNVAAIVARRQGRAAWPRLCLVAGALLVAWTLVELALIPNALSVFYLAVGIVQLAAGTCLVRGASTR